MAESITIDKENKLAPALDYNFLRQEGIRFIESLSGKVWSDYNTHDPGITLMEAMCYALTDLGYRTSFNIEDLIAPASGTTTATWQKIFYTARQVLPVNPLTLVDYRKLIIDTEGVRNAWIEISDDYEVLMYLQKTQVNPLTNQNYNLTSDYKKGEDVLHLRGLYKVFVAYEDDVLADKREEEVAKVIWQKLHFHRNLTEDFISVAPVEYEDFPIEAIIQVHEGTDIETVNARIYKVIHDFFSPPINFYSLEQMIEKNIATEDIFEGPILNYGFIDDAELLLSERFKNIHLSDVVNIISDIDGVIAVKKFAFPVDSQSPFSNFTEWVNTVKDKQKSPRLDIENSTITFERSGDRNRTDEEKLVNKERVHAIYAFLNSDDFKTRLKGAGKDLAVPAGEFMDTATYYSFQKELPAVYGMQESFINSNDKVDSIAIIKAMDELLIEKVGVQAAMLINILLSDKNDRAGIEKHIDRLGTTAAHNNELIQEMINSALGDDPGGKKLKKIIHELLGDTTHASGKEVLYNYAVTNPQYIDASGKARALQQLAATEMKKKLYQVTNSGDIIKLDELYIKYRVDTLGKRKKLVLQLRGFLMVFEQVLADYLSQLSHISNIFSFDTAVEQVFYPQVPNDINDLEALFIDFEHYKKSQRELVETKGDFLTKRNAVLDHLLSRFAESMGKYEFFMQQYEGKEAGKRLIEDKINFLTDYVQVSSYRGKGYNYADPDNCWNSNNVEGVKKRICRLLGIKNYDRKRIAPHALTVKKIKLENAVERYVAILADPENHETVLLKSIEYEFESEALIISTYILEHGYDESLYVKEGHGDKWHFVLKRLTPDNAEEYVAHSHHFHTSAEREAAYEKTLAVLNDITDDENFHLIDHILLRPKAGPWQKGAAANVSLLPVEYVPDKIAATDAQTTEAPYKYKIQNTRDQANQRNVWRLGMTKNNKDFLVVNEDFVFYKHLTRRIENLREAATESTNYVPGKNVDGSFPFKIVLGETTLAESKQKYKREEDYKEDVDGLIKFLSYEMGLVTAPTDDNNPALYADPYSLQVSYIFPGWQRRFRNSTFKHLLEKTIYLETPSHIYPHVYWLSHHEMKEFDKAYEMWVKEMATTDIPATDIVNNMINVLIKVKN